MITEITQLLNNSLNTTLIQQIQQIQQLESLVMQTLQLKLATQTLPDKYCRRTLHFPPDASYNRTVCGCQRHHLFAGYQMTPPAHNNETFFLFPCHYH